MNKKELIEKIETLEEKVSSLEKFAEHNRDLFEGQKNLITFLSEHNRDEVVVKHKFVTNGLFPNICINYIYNGNLWECSFVAPFMGCCKSEKVVKNGNDSCVVELQYGKSSVFYRIDKTRNTYMEVTDLFEKSKKEDDKKK